MNAPLKKLLSLSLNLICLTMSVNKRDYLLGTIFILFESSFDHFFYTNFEDNLLRRKFTSLNSKKFENKITSNRTRNAYKVCNSRQINDETIVVTTTTINTTSSK